MRSFTGGDTIAIVIETSASQEANAAITELLARGREWSTTIRAEETGRCGYTSTDISNLNIKLMCNVFE